VGPRLLTQRGSSCVACVALQHAACATAETARAMVQRWCTRND
jgi:hypothetical protein